MTYLFTLNGEDLAVHTATVGPDAAHAADLDCAREAWRVFPIHDRPTFGAFVVNYLRERGLELAPVREPLECGETPFTGDVIAALFPNLLDSPHTRQALSMSVETIADLLGALDERGLRWVPGEDGACGTLIEGAPEPPDLHVVFDCFRNVWQRDDDRAAETQTDPALHWFSLVGRCATWGDLHRVYGPPVPDGGIAPTTPAGADGCEGGCA